MNNEDEELKKLQCIEAMYSENGIVSSAARDYYYTNYATKEEREKMDKEDRMYDLIGTTVAIAVYIFMGLALILGIIETIRS